jgi:two-component system, HptB-dependent secretion and biofilm response regulator
MCPRFLVVDDQHANRMHLSAILNAGYENVSVVEASSGVEALKAVRDEVFDCIFMDAVMPGLDGFNTIERIRLEQEAANAERTPILMVTGLSEENALEKGLTVGADDFVCRPVSAAVLRARTTVALKALETRRALKRAKDELSNEHATAEHIYAHLMRTADATRSTPPQVGYSLQVERLTPGFSGDLVLSHCVSENRMDVLFADCSGHGLPAAIVAFPLLQAFNLGCEQAMAPSAILRNLNKALREGVPLPHHASALYLSIQDDTLFWWNGGMPSAVASRVGGPTEFLVSKNLPLRLVDDDEQDWSLQAVDFPVGSRLLAATDGVTEAIPGMWKAWTRHPSQVPPTLRLSASLFHDDATLLRLDHRC